MEWCPSERPRCHGWCLQYPASAPGGPRRPWMFWMIGLWPVDLQFDGILEQVMSGPPGPTQYSSESMFFSFLSGAVMSCEAIFAYSSTCYLYLFVWRIFQGTSLDQISQRRQAARWCLSPCSSCLSFENLSRKAVRLFTWYISLCTRGLGKLSEFVRARFTAMPIRDHLDMAHNWGFLCWSGPGTQVFPWFVSTCDNR